MKKLLGILLVLAMLLTCAPMALAEEAPVEVTMFYPSSRPMNELTDLTRQYVIENVGVDMNLIQGGDNWQQQLALFVSGGDIPDLMAFMDQNTFLNYAQEGVFYDISGIVRDYENIMAYLNYVNGYTAEEALARVSIDGAIYGIPSLTIARSYYSTNIRTDWLEKLGLAIPTTLDEFRNVMYQFTFGDPDGDGQDNTYGFNGRLGYDYLTPFFGAFGARPNESYQLDENGAVVTNVLSKSYYDALVWLADCYKEGLIDPETFTQSDSEFMEKWVRGEFGLCCGWWSASGNVVARYGFKDANPDATLEVIDPPVGADGKTGVIAQDPCENYMGIAYNTENIDAVMKLIDFAMSDYGHRVLMWGLEDQFWTRDENGKLDWVYSSEGKDKLGNETTDMQVYRFFYNIAIENESKALGKSYADSKWLNSIDIYTDIATIPDLFVGLTSADYVTYGSDLATYVKEMGVKFITGEASLETDWAGYVNTYLSMGGDMVRESLLEAYNAKNGTALTFAEDYTF